MDIVKELREFQDALGRPPEFDDVLTIGDDAADEIIALRKAARLCWERGWMVSGSIEMAECDAFCKSVGLEPWTWKRSI